MSPKVKEIFKNLIILLCILNNLSFVFGKCLLRLSKNPDLRPNIAISFGSRKVNLHLNKADEFVKLAETQNVDLRCPTKFKYPEQFDGSNNVNLECRHNRLHSPDYRYSSDPLFECSSQQWMVYESLQNFVWCEENSTSYLLARPLNSNTSFEYRAGVCYDTKSFSFRSIYYTISSKYSDLLHPRALGDFYTPTLEIKQPSEIFGSTSIMETQFDDQDVQDWMKYTLYNYSSVIQDTLLKNEFNDQLGSLLDFIWWPNLRLGNWKRYEIALRKQVEKQKFSYDILAGVSAVAEVPIVPTCQTNFTLQEIIYNTYSKVPKYVWNYLRSTKNSSDEFVIIGFNSPFYEFYTEKDVVFCEDKCKDIAWLDRASSTFRYSIMGRIFCCSSEDVKMSKRLKGFPDIDMNS